MQKNIEEQIKIRRVLLQTLQIPITKTPYSRNKKEINRKIKEIYTEIEQLQEKLKEYNNKRL